MVCSYRAYSSDGMFLTQLPPPHILPLVSMVCSYRAYSSDGMFLTPAAAPTYPPLSPIGPQSDGMPYAC